MAAVSAAGKHALVVGGTSGIGEGIAMHLAGLNAAVTICGRDAERGAAIVKAMTARSTALPSPQHAFVPCDVSLLANVRKCATTVAATTPVLDFLVLTQGVGSLAGWTPTSEGLDYKLALHYYSRVAFIDALLPQLRAAPSARVLSVLAAGAHGPYTHWADDPEVRSHYSLSAAAEAATMYNDIAADSLARENPGITFIHAAPGFVATRWGRDMPWPARLLVRAIQPLGTSPAVAATTLCKPLLAPPDDPFLAGGMVLMDANGRRVQKTSLHDAAREGVWAHTLSVLRRCGTVSRGGNGPGGAEKGARGGPGN